MSYYEDVYSMSQERRDRNVVAVFVASAVIMVCGLVAVILLAQPPMVASAEQDGAFSSPACPLYVYDNQTQPPSSVDCPAPVRLYTSQTTTTTVVVTREAPAPVKDYKIDRICQVTGNLDSGQLRVVGANSTYLVHYPFAPEATPVVGEVVRIDFTTLTVSDGYGRHTTTTIDRISPAPEAGGLSVPCEEELPVPATSSYNYWDAPTVVPDPGF